jgi:hypothetical protein
MDGECGAMRNDTGRGRHKNLSQCYSCPPKVTWTDQGTNQGLGGDKPVTNRLNQGKAPFLVNLINPQTLLRCVGSCAYITPNLPQPHGLLALERRRWWEKGRIGNGVSRNVISNESSEHSDTVCYTTYV